MQSATQAVAVPPTRLAESSEPRDRLLASHCLVADCDAMLLCPRTELAVST
jgi:hypothetical protein